MVLGWIGLIKREGKTIRGHFNVDEGSKIVGSNTRGSGNGDLPGTVLILTQENSKLERRG